MAGIYIHIPFCKSKCVYCDFYSEACGGERYADFVSAVKKELLTGKGYVGEVPVRTVYFGGGTPSLMPPESIQDIINAIGDIWDCRSVEEITLEANPDDLSEGYLARLARTGVNRLSIGIQSFSERNLLFMRRRHNSSQSIKAVKDAKKSGFSNITVDLIYGIPGMGVSELKEDLQQALDLDVEHISAYHLTVEDNTGLGEMLRAGRFLPVGEKESEEQYSVLHETLTAVGFEHYEISNFAKSGFRALHNSSYWSGEHYLGVGPSAHSYNGVTRRKCVSRLAEYIDGKVMYETEELTPEDRYNEYIMTSLRRLEGINGEELLRRFGQRAFARFETASGRFLEQGLLAYGSGCYSIPPGKFLLSDHIISELFVVK